MSVTRRPDPRKVVNEIRAVCPIHIASLFQVGAYPHHETMRYNERFAAELIPAVENEFGPLATA